ncbi:MAG TPA: hypothetical protein VE757_10970 [Gaiellaceae bacterium]|nr:hypothetical protein [Gaiellaceae bacterium]
MTVATDWVTISALATAGGTLVLALATFASVRSANRAARVAERSLLAGLRPLLLPSRLEDPTQKVAFVGGKYLVVPGGSATAECSDEAVLVAASLRNAGSGIAVLQGWFFYPELNPRAEHPARDEFTRFTRDIYLAAGEVGFWQGSFRDPSSEAFAEARTVLESGGHWMVDVLYSDAEGGQHLVSRYTMNPRGDGGWLVVAGRQWSVDGVDPRYG